uniref:Uncharacterized protein n=1 Tax=Arundo donax TaxID=35708 RepID=A0A0A9E6V9_ARUDO
MEPVQFVPHGGGGAMSHDGDARSLEAEAAVAALSARELREAAASLAARSDADEDSLGRPALVFNADDIQHLQTLATLDPFILDKVIVDGNVKVEEQALNAPAAVNSSTGISDSCPAMPIEDSIDQ